MKGTSGEAGEGNVRVWSVKDGALIASFHQKIHKPFVIQWDGKESVCGRLVSNELQLLSSDLQTVSAKLYLKGIAQFKLAPTASSSSSSAAACIVAFVPEIGGNPARASIHKLASSSDMEFGPAIVSRTMFAASEADLHWNSLGTHVLVHTHTDVDTSGSSYYGASSLYILSADGKISSIVSQSKEGPVYGMFIPVLLFSLRSVSNLLSYKRLFINLFMALSLSSSFIDIKWSPLGTQFVVAAGNMPSHCTLYNAQAEALYEYGSAHRNTIAWSPHGRFLCLAGFGNLAGEMDFYDTVRKNRKMGSNTAHCTINFGWSPDSRYFMVATLAPRMNVDNGVKIFKYNGMGPVFDERMEFLYDAAWRPAPIGTFEDRPPSPRPPSGEEEGKKEALDSGKNPEVAKVAGTSSLSS